MKIPLLLSLMFLAAFLLGAGGAEKNADANTKPTATTTPNGPVVVAGRQNEAVEGQAGPGDSMTASTAGSLPVPFAARLDMVNSINPIEIKEKGLKYEIFPPEGSDPACVTKQGQFNAYGFYRLIPQPDHPIEEVNFSVYSRIQYYSLTPEKDGDIVIPDDWKELQKGVTKNAHRQGSKVDLVITNQKWPIDATTDATGSATGLRLTKSYVVLTLIDDVVDAVRDYGFDGVTIDFRLPSDPATQDSYTFLINRLKNRLERLDKEPQWKGGTGLLSIKSRQLNIVIDPEFVKALVSEVDEQISPMDIKRLENILDEVSESVDLLLVERRTIEKKPKGFERLIDDHKPKNLAHAIILPNEEFSLGDETKVGIWDVAGEGKEWNEALNAKVFGEGLQSKVFGSGGFNPQKEISKLVCASRDKIANTLMGAGQFLAFLVLLSWVFYDFPKWPKKSISNLIIWGSIAISFVVFILLIIGLPSHNWFNIKFFIIPASFVIPLAFLISKFSSKGGEKDYP